MWFILSSDLVKLLLVQFILMLRVINKGDTYTSTEGYNLSRHGMGTEMGSFCKR